MFEIFVESRAEILFVGLQRNDYFWLIKLFRF